MIEPLISDEELLGTRLYIDDTEELRGAGDAFIESTTPRSYWGTLL